MPRRSKAKQPGPKETGRPRKGLTEAQWRMAEEMAGDMCTAQEIADRLGIGRRTLYEPHNRERFEDVMRRKSAATKWRVRKRQLQQVLKSGTNPVPVIW